VSAGPDLNARLVGLWPFWWAHSVAGAARKQIGLQLNQKQDNNLMSDV